MAEIRRKGRSLCREVRGKEERGMKREGGNENGEGNMFSEDLESWRMDYEGGG